MKSSTVGLTKPRTPKLMEMPSQRRQNKGSCERFLRQANKTEAQIMLAHSLPSTNKSSANNWPLRDSSKKGPSETSLVRYSSPHKMQQKFS